MFTFFNSINDKEWEMETRRFVDRVTLLDVQHVSSEGFLKEGNLLFLAVGFFFYIDYS